MDWRRAWRVADRLGARIPALSDAGRRSADHPLRGRDQEAATVGRQAGERTARRVQGPQGQGEEDKELGKVALTRDFKETVKERAARDPAFAKAMLDEAATAFLKIGRAHV